MTCTLPRQGLYAPNSPPPPPPQHPWFHTIITYRYKRRFPVRFRVLTGLTHATLRADCGSCVLARLMHATGLCATGGCRIQASTRDRLVHKSGLCTRHYGRWYNLLLPIFLQTTKFQVISKFSSEFCICLRWYLQLGENLFYWNHRK